MVKDIHHLTIRDYNLFEKTGDLSYLMARPLPPRLFGKQIEALLEQINNELTGEHDQASKLRREFHRIKSLNRIQIMILLYQAAYNLLMNRTIIDGWWKGIGKPRKCSQQYFNLVDYVQSIEDATGIPIRPEHWYEDMVAVKEQIDLWVDKYNENFGNIPADADGLTFMQIVLGVFATLGFPINDQISMSDFFTMKKQAQEIARKWRAQADGGQH